jgi:hypothetical protein
MTAVLGTQAWATDRAAEHPIVERPRRATAVQLIGAVLTRTRKAAAGRLSDAADLAGLGLMTVGAAHLPGSWGEVGVWVMGGLSLLITSAKLNA